MSLSFIARENPRNALLTIEKAAKLIESDEVSIGIYPEGTRSKECVLLPFHNGVFKIAQKASVAVLTGSQEKIETMRQAFEERRNYMVQRMNQIEGISCIKPEGAFYVMMNVEKIVGKELFGQVIHSDNEFASLFLKYGKVAVVPGSGFGAPNFIRWSYAASMDNIKAGLDRLEMLIQGKAV